MASVEVEATPEYNMNDAKSQAALAKSCVSAIVSLIPPAFCWISDNAGVIPTGCPNGYHRDGALCYEDCRDGERFVGGVCWSTCGGGWTDTGALCSKCGSTKNFPWFKCSTKAKSSHMPKSITNFDSRIPCRDGYYKSLALCYKDCKILGMVECGIGGCAASKSSCASTILTMAVDSISSAVSITSLVLSVGTAAPASTAS